VDEKNGINFGLGHLKDVWLVVKNTNVLSFINNLNRMFLYE